MAKILSAEEARLQKKLIPLNIFVFILSLVAALSLMFTPFIKINVGKILRDENVITYEKGTFEKLIDEKLNASAEEGFRLNFSPVIASAVVEVLEKSEGTVELTPLVFCRFATDKREDKLEILLDGLVYGEKGFVTEIVNSLVAGVADAFTSEKGKGAIEDAFVDSLVSSMGGIANSSGEDMSEVIREKVTAEKKAELKEILLGINNAKSENDVDGVMGSFVDKFNETLGGEYLTQDKKDAVSAYFVGLYNETHNWLQGSEFSLEAMICVAVSKNVNLNEVNINNLLEAYADELSKTESEEEPAPASKALTEGEESETPVALKTPVTYSELFSRIGLDSDQIGGVSDNMNKIVKIIIDNNLSGLGDSLKEKGWVYQWIYVLVLAGIMLFVVLWVLLALTALIRTFTKNKRYSMWYVKLLEFIPPLIFVGLFVLKTWGASLLGGMPSEKLGLVMGVLGGVSSYTWISGICYLLLWFVSIFWAFPIKRKIRKERKACKEAGVGAYNYSSSYNNNPYGYPAPRDKAPGYLGSDPYYDYDYAYDDDDDYDYDYDYDYDDYYDYDDDDDDDY